MTLTSVISRENNWICVKAKCYPFSRGLLLFTGQKRKMKPEVFCVPNTSATASAMNGDFQNFEQP